MAVTTSTSSHPAASPVLTPNTAVLTCNALICLPPLFCFLSCFAAAPCFSATSCVCPPPSENQAHWLFQSPTRTKPSPGSTTAAGLVGSCRSRRARLCFCTSEPLMTGGRDGTTGWRDWCPTSTLWSKTGEMCSTRKSHAYLAFGTGRSIGRELSSTFSCFS